MEAKMGFSYEARTLHRVVSRDVLIKTFHPSNIDGRRRGPDVHNMWPQTPGDARAASDDLLGIAPRKLH